MKSTNGYSKDPIFVNAATGMNQWLLFRESEQLQVVGALLTMMFLTAHEHGWSPRDLFSVDGDMTCLNLRDFHFTDSEAHELSTALESSRTGAVQEKSKDLDLIESAFAFVARGAFSIGRPNARVQEEEPQIKGFAGLSAFASDLDDFSALPSPSKPRTSTTVEPTTATGARTRSNNTDDAHSSETPKKPAFSNEQIGMAFIGVLILFLIIASMSSGSGKLAPDTNVASTSSLALPEKAFLSVAATSANLREKASSNSRQLKVLHFGDRLEYLNVTDTFTQVKLGDSTVGYMASGLLIPEKDFERLKTLPARHYVDQRMPEKRIDELFNQSQPMRDHYIEAITSVATRSTNIQANLQTIEDTPRIVISADKSAGTLYSLSAKVSANAGNLDEAFWNARAAVEADPTNPDYHVALALSSYQGGNMDAVKAAAKILPLLAPKTTNAWMIFGLAEALDETDNKFDEVAVGSFVLAIKLSKNPAVTRKYFLDLIDKSDKPRVRKLLTDALAEESSNAAAFGY